MANQAYNVTEAIRKIKAVNFALENLEVKGRQNMDILLGSMQAIDTSIRIIEAAFKELNQPASQEPEIKLEVVPEEEAPAE